MTTLYPLKRFLILLTIFPKTLLSLLLPWLLLLGSLKRFLIGLCKAGGGPCGVEGGMKTGGNSSYSLFVWNPLLLFTFWADIIWNEKKTQKSYYFFLHGNKLYFEIKLTVTMKRNAKILNAIVNLVL